MFEAIHRAYQLLSNVELKLLETDLMDVVLFLKTQNIIYRRFPEAVSDQKYVDGRVCVCMCVYVCVRPEVRTL